jgi:WD40 repeat protein
MIQKWGFYSMKYTKITLLTLSAQLSIGMLSAMQQVIGVKRPLVITKETETGSDIKKPKVEPIAADHHDVAMTEADLVSRRSSSSFSSSSSQAAPAKDADGDHAMSSGEMKKIASSFDFAQDERRLDSLPFPRGITNLIKDYIPETTFNPWDYVEAFQEHNGILRHSINGPSDYCEIYQLDGRQIATARYSGAIEIWDILKQERIAELEGHPDDIIGNIIKLQDGRIASSCNPNYDNGDLDEKPCVKFWDVTTQKCTGTIEFDHVVEEDNLNLYITQLKNSQIALCIYGKGITIWDPMTYKQIVPLFGEDQYQLNIIKLGDGNVAGYHTDGEIMVWDVNARACIACLEGTEDGHACSNIVQLRDGRIASTAAGGHFELRLWDYTKNIWTTLCSAKGKHEGPVQQMIQLSDTRIAFSSYHELGIWDIAANKKITSFKLDTSIEKLMLLDDFRILVQTYRMESETGKTQRTIHIFEISKDQINIVKAGLEVG